jgi:hypothetical protein
MAKAPTTGKDKTSKVASRDIGIVVIGRNEGDRLTRCLQSLQMENLPVIYVDSGSTDGSQEIWRKCYCARFVTALYGCAGPKCWFYDFEEPPIPYSVCPIYRRRL